MRFVFLLVVVLAFPMSDFGQQDCELVDSRQAVTHDAGNTYYVGGPIFVCRNGSRITADSAIIMQQLGRADFMGKVRFTDAVRTLTAQQVQYVSRERKVMAQINVVVTNRKEGSTLEASALDYYQASETYPEGRVDVHPGGRPRGTIIRRRPSGIDTTTIVADRMQIIGERLFRGWGNVETRRGELTSNSQFAEFDEQNNVMRLTGQASVQSDTMRLRADSIEAVLIDGDEFKELHAFRQVIMESEDMKLNAPVVHMNFAEGQVERLVAVGGGRVAEGAPQARAVSPDFVLTADSIDALSPKQKLQRVFAFGKARGERWSDTIADRDLPQLIRNDWVRGDTVLAFFGERKPGTVTGPGAARAQASRPGQVVTGDSTRVLERLVAMGNPASSTYRMREQVGDTVEISVNYITAKKLDVTFKEGEVDNVQAEGDIRGLYLQPPRRAEATTPPPRRP